MTGDDYVPRKKAAKRIGDLVRGKPFNERALIDWERNGKGPPAIRVGRDVVYYWPSVEKWLHSLEKQTA